MNSTFHNRAGFTLTELILVISLLAIAMGGTLISLSRFMATNQLDNTTTQMVQTLRRAQGNAMARKHDSPWGVRFDSSDSAFIFFKGPDYASRDATFDEVTPLPAPLVFSAITLQGGGTAVVFDRMNGETSHTGSIEIREQGGRVVILSVNAYGQIEIN